VDVRDLLPACAQPVLCVVFGADRVVPRHSSEEIMRCQPAARLVTLPGDHFGMYTDPERLADELRDFIGAAQAA
jgi:pimeloyl-ACP methyl ester carboxylesterase